MAHYSLTYETPSEVTAKTYLQWLMGAGRGAQMVACLIEPLLTADPQNSGSWVIDRISALGTGGGALTPKKLDVDNSAASAISSTTNVTAPTVEPTTSDLALVAIDLGIWNWLEGKVDIMSGTAKGFAIRRSTAASGAHVCQIHTIWKEL